MYYKNKNNELYFEPSNEIISRDGLEEITEVEFNELLVIQNTPTPEQELQTKINKAKDFLNNTDKKVLPDYEFRADDNTLEWYIEERKKARAFIRDNS